MVRILAMVPAGNKTKCLSSVNHTTKTIHHHHHHHHHHHDLMNAIETNHRINMISELQHVFNAVAVVQSTVILL